MNEIMNISGVDCYEKDGVIYLRLETVARGLGFTRIAASGNEVVRWETVRKYLHELGVPTSWERRITRLHSRKHLLPPCNEGQERNCREVSGFHCG